MGVPFGMPAKAHGRWAASWALPHDMRLIRFHCTGASYDRGIELFSRTLSFLHLNKHEDPRDSEMSTRLGSEDPPKAGLGNDELSLQVCENPLLLYLSVMFVAFQQTKRGTLQDIALW